MTDTTTRRTPKRDVLLEALLGDDEVEAMAAASILAEKIKALSPEARRRVLEAIELLEEW